MKIRRPVQFPYRLRVISYFWTKARFLKAVTRISMKNRIQVLGMLLSLILFFLSLILPSQYHLEFVYSLIVLLTIWIPGARATMETSVVLSGLIVLGFALKGPVGFYDLNIGFVILPIMIIWAFTLAIIKYKESQERLMRSTEHLNAMFENATEGIIISDEDGKIIMANPRAALQFGFERENLLESKIEDLMPPRFTHPHSMHREGFYKHPRNRPMGQGMNLYAKRKNGEEFPVEISLSSFKSQNKRFVISFIIDITERKKQEDIISHHNEVLEQAVQARTEELARANKSLSEEIRERKKAEEALLDSERLYSTIARNFPDGIICVLDHRYTIVFIDGRELHSMNINRQSLIGKSCSVLPFWPADTDEIFSRMSRVFNWESFQEEFRHADYYYAITCVPLPDKKGNIPEVLLVVQNVTAQKKAQLEIIQSLEKERELNEMKSRFVSIASHEFRTPLSTILSSVALVEKYSRPEDTDKKEKHIERIKNSVKNLTEILNDFLSLERLEAGKVDVNKEEFDLPEFCEDLTEQLQAVCKPGQTIRYRHTGTSRKVYLDRHLLRNILINLLNNAIKYSPENSPIELFSETGEEISVSVRDYGIGIPGEDQYHLFERFFRAGNVTAIQGTGLGLNIVLRYVKLMPGRIEFNSQINKGSTFTVRFPNWNTP